MLVNRKQQTETPLPVIDLSARLAQLRADIETTRRELVTARETADSENTTAILHGGHFDPTLQAKAEQLSVRLSHLEAELKPLAAAERQQRAEAERRALQADAERVAGVKSRYREAVGELVRAQLMTLSAFEKTKEIVRELPLGELKELGLPLSGIPEGIAAWKWAVCQQGYGEFLPDNDHGKALFENDVLYEAAARERFTRQQKINQDAAGKIFQDDGKLHNPDVSARRRQIVSLVPDSEPVHG